MHGYSVELISHVTVILPSRSGYVKGFGEIFSSRDKIEKIDRVMSLDRILLCRSAEFYYVIRRMNGERKILQSVSALLCFRG